MHGFKRPDAGAIAIALGAIVALVGVLSGCASGDDTFVDATAKAGTLELAVTSPEYGARTRKRAVTVKGTVTPGAAVTVDGVDAAVRGRRFRRRVRLHAARNRIVVRAEKAGFADARERIVVMRKRRPITEPITLPEPTPRPTPEPTPDCDPNYEIACLDPNSPDYDCEGGSGDGPDYTGLVRVIGDDHFDLDRDGDGVACE